MPAHEPSATLSGPAADGATPARPPRLATHDAAVAAARAFADAIADGVVERDRSGAAPHAEMARYDESGLLAITVPHADGGAALGPSTLAEITRVIAAVDPAIAQTPQAHYLFVDAMALLGTEAQKRRLLGEVLAGHRIGNALAERGTKHAQDLQTRLARDDAGDVFVGYLCPE